MSVAKRTGGLLAAATATVLALSACSSSAGGNASASGTSGSKSSTNTAECDAGTSAPGVSSSSIELGAFTPLSGPLGALGQEGRDGEQLAFDQVNAAGGIKGHKIDFKIYDDQYSPPNAQQAIRRLVQQDHVFAIVGGLGTPNFVATLPFIKANHIPALAPYAPSDQVGVMTNPDVYMVWPNYADEYKTITDYMITKLGAKKVAILTRPDDVGKDGLAGTKAALAAHHMTLVKEVSADPLATDFSSQAVQLRDSGADAVLIVSQPTGVGQATKAMHDIGFHPLLGSSSDQDDPSWSKVWGKQADGMILAEKATALTSTDPKVVQFVKDFTAKYKQAPGLWNEVGYAQAQLAIQALKTAPALTRDCLQHSLQDMKGLNLGLIPPVTFSANSRQGTHVVGLARLKNGAYTEVKQ